MSWRGFDLLWPQPPGSWHRHKMDCVHRCLDVHKHSRSFLALLEATIYKRSYNWFESVTDHWATFHSVRNSQPLSLAIYWNMSLRSELQNYHTAERSQMAPSSNCTPSQSKTQHPPVWASEQGAQWLMNTVSKLVDLWRIGENWKSWLDGFHLNIGQCQKLTWAAVLVNWPYLSNPAPPGH